MTLQHRIHRWRAVIACRLLGLGKMTGWFRDPRTGLYTYLAGERGWLEGRHEKR